MSRVIGIPLPEIQKYLLQSNAKNWALIHRSLVVRALVLPALVV